MMNAKAMILSLAAAGSVHGQPNGMPEKWMLMSRHGECTKVEALKRKIPELGDAEDPHAFVALMRKKGVSITLRQLAVPVGSSYEVQVLEKGLHLIFVTESACKSIPTR